MIGKIIKYDNINEMGYIEGYDETIYFYHQINVKENKKLKPGDLVSFEYIINVDEGQLPYAVNINKEELNGNFNESTGKSKAYKELYEILNYLPQEEIAKIPTGFLNEVKENMDETYSFNVEHIDDFENQEMLEETRALLAIVYRDYLATAVEKAEILKQEREELQKIEQEKKIKYNSDVFAKKHENGYIRDNNSNDDINRNLENSSVSLSVREKEGWFSKFVGFIKNIFKR